MTTEIIAVLFVVLGLCWSAFPKWFYKRRTPEQESKDRKRFVTFGAIILLLGLVLLGMTAIR
jgi:hypothetical protein